MRYRRPIRYQILAQEKQDSLGVKERSPTVKDILADEEVTDLGLNPVPGREPEGEGVERDQRWATLAQIVYQQPLRGLGMASEMFVNRLAGRRSRR